MFSFLSLLVLPSLSHATAKFTFYDPGLGACGRTNSDNDFIVAMNVPQFNGGAVCNKEITITYNGKTAQATVVDQCMNCPYGGLDFSRGLFNFFADESQGVIYGDWSFALPPTTKTTTNSSTNSEASITVTLPKTSSKSSTTTVSAITISTSTATSSAPTPSSSQVLAQFSDALVSLVGLLVQGAGV